MGVTHPVIHIGTDHKWSALRRGEKDVPSINPQCMFRSIHKNHSWIWSGSLVTTLKQSHIIIIIFTFVHVWDFIYTQITYIHTDHLEHVKTRWKQPLEVQSPDWLRFETWYWIPSGSTSLSSSQLLCLISVCLFSLDHSDPTTISINISHLLIRKL